MNKQSQYLYILRACIQPGHYEEERLETLLSFCKEALIDDVMFFIDCEDLNNGHIARTEVEPWLSLIARAKEKLEPLGITTSINPWVTLNHADRGRKLQAEQNFRLMVDKNGTQATACVCPLCEEWRHYIRDIYAYYASINPYMLWIEDDFRFHNHAPLEWGGCFCDQHMKEYSKKAGKELSREEFIQGILQPGEPHPYRKIWLDTARQTMVTLAEEIGQAVHNVDPHTRLGLMSSIPAVHCAEGRDWEGILKGLSCDTPMVNRPHLPSYQEVSPQSYLWYFNTISVLSKAIVPKSTEIYPEVENSPRTLFAKSRTFTRFQIETSTVLGSKGITLNLFNVMGSGVLPQEGFAKMLGEAKPFLNRITQLNLGNAKQEGVKVLYNTESAHTLKTEHGQNMEELYPTESFWAGLLSAYGIANCYSSNKYHENEIVAVSGQYFRNLTKKQIFDLFEKNFVLLDGEAVYTLYEMGYGEVLNIKDIQWYKQHSGYQAYEEVCNGQKYCGIDKARMSLQRAEGGYFKIEYVKEPEIITEARTPRNKTIGAGMTIVDNRAFILPSAGKDSFFQIHLNTYKQVIVKSVINSVEGVHQPVYVEKEPYVGVYMYDAEDKKVVLVVNASGDELEEVGVYAPIDKYSKIYEINRKCEEPVEPVIKSVDNRLSIITDLDRFEVKAFVIEK